MEIFNATNLLYIWGGFVKTIEISALSIFFSLIFGTVLALVKSYAPRPFRILVSAYIELRPPRTISAITALVNSVKAMVEITMSKPCTVK